MTQSLDQERIARSYETVRAALLAERVDTSTVPSGHWEGELSTSALSTATAIMALELVRRQVGIREVDASGTASDYASVDFASFIRGGLEWLANHQNSDGGWGDTTKSISNISTTMLAHAVFHATDTVADFSTTVADAKEYIDQAGGVAAVLKRYGKDRTFSIPILTHCALAGLVDWRDVIALPFELACIPARFYKAVRLPVVSYALPALIAIGQARHFHRKPWNPLLRLIRKLAVKRSLQVLDSVQPPNGGFLEAAPLTSFVTMSLASMGLVDHPVTRRGVGFLVNSVRADGSWPIDTNLATWVTTLSVNALRDDLPESARAGIRNWLLQQQYQVVHPYTNADPGGWAWTDLPGGVPDSDDTPGAILALLNLRSCDGINDAAEFVREIPAAECAGLANGVRWLLNLQNRDSGWPTFCRGWGTLPFDRSAADLTAHVVRAISAWLEHPASSAADAKLKCRANRAIQTGFQYLSHTQRSDGSWLPLWFGNQFNHDDENPTYGTARVLAAFRDTGRFQTEPARRGLTWLKETQNPDGGWGGAAGVESSVEETALALDVLISDESAGDAASRGLRWLMDRIDDGSVHTATPIGFYFAKLWYFEKLYPLTFTVAALGRAYRVGRATENAAPTTMDQNHRQAPIAAVDYESTATNG